MQPDRARWDSGRVNIIVPAKEKMDKGSGYSEFVIRPLQNKSLCPLKHFLLLKKEAEDRGYDNVLWISSLATPYKQPASISALLR
jgi:hypothetical protein